MHQELAAAPAPTVRILGVNGAGEEAGNPAMVAGRVLPLLQDVPSVDAWGLWDVTPRDVVVVDALGRAYAIYNLTEHDLAVPANYDALKQLLVDATAAPP
jgi:hypothetical protein